MTTLALITMFLTVVILFSIIFAFFALIKAIFTIFKQKKWEKKVWNNGVCAKNGKLWKCIYSYKLSGAFLIRPKHYKTYATDSDFCWIYSNIDKNTHLNKKLKTMCLYIINNKKNELL